jgi:RHS repeat-associated protein
MNRLTHNTAVYSRISSHKFTRMTLLALASFGLLYVLCAPALAQGTGGGMTPPGLAPGKAAGSYAVSGIENVNLYSGNLNFNFPLLKVGSRGQVGTSMNLSLNTARWEIVPVAINPGGDNVSPPRPPHMTEGTYALFDASLTQSCTGTVIVGCGGEESCPSTPVCTVSMTVPYRPSTLQIQAMAQSPDSGETTRYAFAPMWRQEGSWDGLTVGYGPGVVRGRLSTAWEQLLYPNPDHPWHYYPQYHYWQSLYRMTFVDSNGTEHELIDTLKGGQPIEHSFSVNVDRGKVFASNNGSSLTFIADSNLGDGDDPPTGYLFFPDGSRCRVVGGLIQWVRDTNGNVINYTFGTDFTQASFGKVIGIKDSMGREVVITYANMTTVMYDEIKFNGVGGSLNRSIKVWHALLENSLQLDQMAKTIRDLFPGTSRNSNGLQARKFNPFVVSKVELPDGRVYKLKYNSYGDLARAELPTGAVTEYDIPDVVTTGIKIERRVKERRVSSDGGVTWESKQLFTQEYSAGPNNQSIEGWGTTTTVRTHDLKGEDKLVSVQKHYFYGDPLFAQAPNLFYPSWKDGREYKVETLAPANEAVVLRREETDWEQAAPPTWWANFLKGIYQTNDVNAPPNNPRVAETRVTLENGLISKKVFDYSSSTGTPSAPGSYDLLTDTYEYDFAPSGQTGQLLRHTHTDYVKTLNVGGMTYDYGCDPAISCGQSADAANIIHIRNLPQSIEVKDGVTDKIVSRTEFRYDEPGRLTDDYGSLPSGFPGWVEPTTAARGNLTTARVWLDTLGNKDAPTAYLETHVQYDRFGNAVKTWDARGKFSEVKFAAAYKYALPTETVSIDPDGSGPKTSLTTTSAYDPSSGVVLTTTDANGKTTSAEYNDLLDRLTKVIRPDGGWTSYEYGDQVGNLYLHTKTLRESTPVAKTLEGYQFFDAMGRATRATSRTSDNTWSAVATEHDGVGRVISVTNPYETSNYTGPLPESPFLTTTEYDALGRPRMVMTPDGAKVYTLFDGLRTLVTDQAGKQRISRIDALGRLLDVWEVTAGTGTEAITFPVPQTVSVPAVSSGFRTSYAYDALGNLRKVEQGTQRRYFAYDSLSRLIRAKNPEQEATETVRSSLALPSELLSSLSDNNNNWSLKYEYDENGNLKKRTDARGILTEYTYDDLNRVTLCNYSDATPDVTYTYDTIANGKGRLTSVGSSVSTYSYNAYDIMGRATSSTQTTDGVAYPMGEYKYDLKGNLTSQKYPSGRVVTTSYDAAGRLAAVTGQKSGEQEKTYAAGVSYTAAGAVKDLQLGNGLWEQTLYNSRLQVEKIRLGTTSGGINRLNLTYAYGTITNNGNVRSQTIAVPTVGNTAGFTATQSYGYDALNRLLSAEETSGTTQLWKQSYQYDRFGNRRIDTTLDQNSNKKTSDNLKPALLSDNPSFSTANNQINANQGYGYEGAGNLISVPNRNDPAKSYQYEYDAENRQVSFDKEPATPNTKDATYVYDGDGRRVKKIADGVKTVFVYDIAGKLIAEYSSAGSSGGGTSYLTSDLLGTPRVITGSDVNDTSGGVKARHDYLPFGEELLVGRGSYAGDRVRQKFTGYERDSETGLNFAQARYYANTQGRFTSTDPVGVTKYHIQNPQHWNLYLYALNNPLLMVDIDGKFPWTFYIRSFIYKSTIHSFKGDGRGPSLSTDPRQASSRVHANFTLDYDTGRIINPVVKSDISIVYIPGIGAAGQEGSPGIKFSDVETYNHSKSMQLHYWGSDPIPGPLAPDLDVHASIAISESLNKDGTGKLFIAGTLTGDTFPSTEAFIVDQSGKTKVFLGAKHEEGGIGDLVGDNQQDLFKVDMQIRFDQKGIFTAVIQGGKTYTIEAWNKKVQGEF